MFPLILDRLYDLVAHPRQLYARFEELVIPDARRRSYTRPPSAVPAITRSLHVHRASFLRDAATPLLLRPLLLLDTEIRIRAAALPSRFRVIVPRPPILENVNEQIRIRAAIRSTGAVIELLRRESRPIRGSR